MTKGPYSPLELKALLCFSTTARLGSLTRAGIELGISDSAVSQRIRSLEKHLGAKLYEARGGKVRLTDAGRRTEELASRLFDQISELEDDILDLEYRGTVALSTSAPIIRYQLPEIVTEFRKQFPLGHLRLHNRPINETINLVRSNQVDFGIIARRSTLPGELIFYPWRTFRASVLIPRGHAIARNGPPPLSRILTTDTLSQYPQVVPDTDEEADQKVRIGLESLGLPYNVSLEVGDLDDVKQYCKRGHGLAVVNGVCLSDEDKKDFYLVEIPKEFDSDITYGILLLKGKYISKPLVTLLDLFRNSTHSVDIEPNWDT